ncbi:MAG: hypothetical protein NT013_12980 [Planctomycetia bacterium]|nr:hypothetical protein [Planctomycetia bacterium]
MIVKLNAVAAEAERNARREAIFETPEILFVVVMATPDAWYVENFNENERTANATLFAPTMIMPLIHMAMNSQASSACGSVEFNA